MARPLFRTIVPILAIGFGCASSAHAQAPAAQAPAARRAKASGLLPLYFTKRPAMDGSQRMIQPATEAPVILKLTSPPTASDVSALSALGVNVQRRRDGTLRGWGNYLLAGMPASAVDAVTALPRVESIEPDGTPFDSPSPLEGTAMEVQATDAWRAATSEGAPLTGRGVVICNIDYGINQFHPLLFRADGGYVSWVDVDGNGVFAPGVDAVDLDGDGQPTVLRVLDMPVMDTWKDKPMFGSDDPGFAVGMDWLYTDTNGNGARDFGPAAGFTEQDPTYGERLFAVDDVNRNGVLDAGERLVALGTSKIRSVRYEQKSYRRGEDLIGLSMADDDRADIDHGTASSGVLVGGALGLTRLVGIAPDAELVLAFRGTKQDEVANMDYCVEEGARVVLHEYAPWIARPLDGSSPQEAFIDETAKQGVVHVNPAGNLSGAKKLYKGAVPAGQELVIPIDAPQKPGAGAYRALSTSLLWRDPSRDLAVTIEDPTGKSMLVTVNEPNVPLDTPWESGLRLWSVRTTSSRGTARVDISLYASTAAATVPFGAWKLRVADGAPAGSPEVPVITYVMDDRSGWGVGIHFAEGVSEDHLIGAPGTADHGLAVAAYTGNGWYGDEPGERAYYSGRGRRIDGEPILWISAPDDPITAGYSAKTPFVHRIFGGTSGASPHVAGAAALLVQADPSRSSDDVREAIKKGALVDESVGAAPNEDYGHGKLRIHESLFGEAPPGGAAPTITFAPAKVEAGKPATLPIAISDPDEPTGSLVIEADRDYDGEFEEKLAAAELPVSLAKGDIGIHVFKIRVTDSTGRRASALARVEVVPASVPQEQEEPNETPSTEAGGCAVQGSREASGSALAAMVLSVLAMLRRRRAPGARS